MDRRGLRVFRRYRDDLRAYHFATDALAGLSSVFSAFVATLNARRRVY